LAAAFDSQVDIQAFSCLLAQQHSRRTFSPVAGENSVSVRDVAVDTRGCAGDRSVVVLGAVSAVAADAGGPRDRFDLAEPACLSGFVPAQRATLFDGD